MAKVRVTIELDLDTDSWTDGEIHQTVWDSYIHYVTLAHLEDTLTWLVKSQNEPENIAARHIYEHHKVWADITTKANNSYKLEIIRG